jgi:hypothetical protein
MKSVPRSPWWVERCNRGVPLQSSPDTLRKQRRLVIPQGVACAKEQRQGLDHAVEASFFLHTGSP